jgi:chromate transporter
MGVEAAPTERGAAARGAAARGAAARGAAAGGGLWPLVAYFLRLGALGFGGPVALVGYMQRDLVERRRWVDDGEYKLGLALAQIMPGPLAAQLAIAIGYFGHGVVGATLVGVAFVLPSFLMVLALSALYVAYGGVVVDAGAVLRHFGGGDRDHRHRRLQAGAEGERPRPLALGHLRPALRRHGLGPGRAGRVLPARRSARAAGQAPPRWLSWRRGRLPGLALAPPWLAAPALAALAAAASSADLLWQILLFFTEAGAFVFGSGLAIVPFLRAGVVDGRGWLTEQQFLDAVAVAMITPGPVVITVAFIGYLVAGLPGATVAALGIFLPVWVLTVLPAPWFVRHRDNAQLRAFSDGATAAASGAIAGAVVLLALRAVVDLPTALIALGSFGLLWRFKLPEPLLVVGAGLLGLALRPLAG